MMILYLIASIIGLILIMAGIFVPVSPASEILVAFGMLVLLTEVLFLIESHKIETEAADDEKDGDDDE